jgi:hypothetical protein
MLDVRFVNRTLKWMLRVPLIVIIGYVVVSVVYCCLPLGKGSMRYAREWKQRLDQCTTLADVTNTFEYHDVTGTPGGGSYGKLTLRRFTNGSWIVMNSENSHGNPWGGTIVTRDSTGKTRVFFGHVCGAETLRGNSLQEAYTFIARTDREEVFLDENGDRTTD